MKKKLKTIIILLIFILLMTMSFNFNIFRRKETDKQQFSQFQLDSEDLIIGRMIIDKYNLNNNKYGLQYIDGIKPVEYKKYYEVLNTGKLKVNNEEIIPEIKDYKSIVGLQGFVFSFLFNKLNFSIHTLHLICSLLLAIVLTVICYLFKERYGILFSAIFYIGCLLSPWLIDFAKNLYWVEFTWFLPLMLCLLLDKTNNKRLYLPLIFIAVLVKCLCGYEYISTILLTMISFLIVDFILKKEKRKEIIKTIFLVGIVSILAFLVAICIHANLRGEGNIAEGVHKIIQEDVMRRTIGGNPASFSNKVVKKSIQASFLETIKIYFNFNTDIIIGIPSNTFVILCVSSLMIAIYNIVKKRENSKRDLIMYLVFLASTISWYVLGKAHSYVHTGLNFVLWYFGYIQMSFYIVVKFILKFVRDIKEEELK